jgi:hypothetical protein
MMAPSDDQCWQSGGYADLVDRTHGRVDPSTVVQSHEELFTPARRSYTGCAPGCAANVNWQAHQ